MAKVKCPPKLDTSVFYQLTRRLPHEDGLNYDDERLLIHFYDTFYNESMELLGCTIRCRVNVLYHLLRKIGKEPRADLFQFMKGPGHQRTDEEIEFVFKCLGWDYFPIKLDKGHDIINYNSIPKINISYSRKSPFKLWISDFSGKLHMYYVRFKTSLLIQLITSAALDNKSAHNYLFLVDMVGLTTLKEFRSKVHS